MSRLVDPGAVFAGWVGLGVALIVAISFELIVAIQAIVFLVAVPVGLLIGYYANARAARRRPWGRVVANALYAGLLTGLGLALLYGGLRLLFVYADTGYREGTQGGAIVCATGPDCTYQRYLQAGYGADLAAAGVHDGATFERWFLQDQLNGALALLALTAGGALAGGCYYAVAASARPKSGDAAGPAGASG